MLASRLNNQVVAVDAFTVSWTQKRFYAFPPFSVIGQAIAKIRED